MDLMRKRYSRPGTAPGTLRPPAERRTERVMIRVMDYAPDSLEERELTSVEEAFAFRDSGRVTWIDIVGLHDLAVISRLGEHFGLHPLALEDVLNTGQRPKVENYGDHLFLVMKELRLTGEPKVVTEQICLFLGPDFVITLQEIPGDPFQPVRERLRQAGPRIRRGGADYLAYALLDLVVDQHFPILEDLGDRIERLEDELLVAPGTETLAKIQDVRRCLLGLRRAAWPQREVVNRLERWESSLIQAETKVFLRDVYDHTVQVIDMLETYRELGTSLLETYMSTLSHRLNETMRTLTVIASIFIPLTFLVGVYGMNFNPAASPWNMPELNWYWGYPASLAAMAVIAAGMLVYFKRKGWM
jgi:magnesium transporter